MPITVFHLGPAVLIKSAGRRHFSFMVFGITQVFIDLESGYNFLQGNWPMHNFLHTFVGASIAAVICALLGKPLGERLLRFWNRWLSQEQAHWLAVDPGISWWAAINGAVLGGYSHVLLDGIMHSDVRPGAPWTDANPLLHWITLSQLHWLCIATAFLGLIFMLPGWWKRKSRPKQE